MAPIPVVDLRGPDDPFSQGVEYGRAASGRIDRSVAFYRRLLPALTGRSWDRHRRAVASFQAEATVATPNVVELLRGTAAGSGQDLTDLWVVSCRSELMARSSIVSTECTAIHHADGLAQTWDWFTAQRASCVVLRTRRRVTLTEAGMPAKIGCNAAGLAVTLNFLATGPPPSRPGVPVHLLIAELLEEADSVAAAVALIARVPIACSATIGLADATGGGAFVELTPHHRPLVLDAGSTAVHTNHCLAAPLVDSDQLGPLLVNSRRRLERATALLEAGVAVTDVLSDAVVPASAIDVPPTAGARREAALGTVAAVVIDVRRRELALAPGRPSSTGFVQRVAV